jgi:hypothetical protein
LGSKLKKLKLHKKGASGGGFGSQLLAEANPIVSAMLKQIKKKDRKFNELASKPLQHKVVYHMLSETIFEKVFQDIDNADFHNKAIVTFPTFLYDSTIMHHGLHAIALRHLVQIANSLIKIGPDQPYGFLLS